MSSRFAGQKNILLRKESILLSCALVASIFFITLTVFVAARLTQSVDVAILLWFNSHASYLLDSFFTLSTELGGTVVLATITSLLFLVFLLRKQYVKATFIAATVGGSALLNLILKGVFERTRPDLWERIVDVSNYSYPSGHALSSSVFALVVIALLWNTRWRTAALVLSPLYIGMIGISRLYLGVHYPSDVVGGWLLGVAWVSLIAVVFIYVLSSRHSRRAA